MPTLNWIGKDAVLNHRQDVPFHLLRCAPVLSVGNPDNGNLCGIPLMFPVSVIPNGA